MRAPYALLIAAAALSGCHTKQTTSNSAQRIEFEPQSVTIVQRTAARLRGVELRLRIGDISGGKVLVQLEHLDGEPVVPMHSMRVGDKTAFEHSGQSCSLGLVAMNNFLFGDDFAEFQIGSDEDVAKSQTEALLRRIETSNLTFVRNGKEYSGPDAAAHLRRKLDFSSAAIESGADFITHVASTSSSTGQPYMVRIGSHEVRLDAWLRGSLPK